MFIRLIRSDGKTVAVNMSLARELTPTVDNGKEITIIEYSDSEALKVQNTIGDILGRIARYTGQVAK